MLQESNIEVLRFRDEQFTRVAVQMGWEPGFCLHPWEFIHNKYLELIDFHDLVKKQALERRHK